MPEQMIRCPNCLKEIPLTEAFTKPLEEHLRMEFEEKVRERERSFNEELKRKEDSFKKKEESLKESRAELERAQSEMEITVAQRVYAERAKLAEEIRKKEREENKLQMEDLKGQLEEKMRRLEEAEQKELDLRKAQREIEEKGRKLELEVQRKLDEERKAIRDRIVQETEEQQRLKDAEKEEMIRSLREQIEVLKRKAEQGSQQLQGEVLELDLEDHLRSSFPMDVIEPVPKGVRGADIVQKVRNEVGQLCGIMIWESKRTKNWSDQWIAKLREDLRELKGDLAVLCTQTMPKEVSSFDCMGGVVVTAPHLAMPVAGVLRNQLMEVARAKRSSEGRMEKSDMLYSYLTGLEFRQRMESIVESFMEMKHDLDKERASMNKLWEKREKQMLRAITNLSRVYGSMQGIAGESLPQIESLEIAKLSEGPEAADGGNLDDY